MDYNVQRMFIINMVLNGVSEEKISATLDIPIKDVKAIIADSKTIIDKKRSDRDKAKIEKENEARDIIKINRKKANLNEGKKEFKNKNVKEEEKTTEKKKNKTIQDLRNRIINGQEYSMEEVKKLTQRVKRACLNRRSKELVEELIDIYMQLNLYENARLIVRDIFDDKSKVREIMEKQVRQRELKYLVMKMYRAGKNYNDISDDLRIFTVDVIKIVREESELDDKIINMLKDGFKKEEIVNHLDINIQRVNDALCRTKSPKEEREF